MTRITFTHFASHLTLVTLRAKFPHLLILLSGVTCPQSEVSRVLSECQRLGLPTE